jgi:1-acyl-sn-glycerol-3-phosphate acyltransferase
MRSVLFAVVYWVLSVVYGLVAALSAIVPGRDVTAWVIRRYVKRMVQAMRYIAGIRIEARGRENLPPGAFIIASKHQSWGDGFATYHQFDDLAFVTGDHLERMPLIGTVLRKLGAIVVKSCGGSEARGALQQRASEAHREGRRILIFPEGRLARVGERYRYRSGVWHMYRDLDLPVVPLATNLGLFWPADGSRKKAGTATLAFLDMIPVGLAKDEFMTRLEAAIEGVTADLVAEATGQPARPAILVDDLSEGVRAAAG